MIDSKLLVYPCQLCGAKTKGGMIYRIPGFKMGSMMFEQMVCKPCLDKHCEHVDGEFWAGHEDKGPGCCCGCGCDLKKEKICQIQSSLNDDGTWNFSPVCEMCFCKFDECCKKMKQK